MAIEKSLSQAPLGLDALQPDLEIEIENPDDVTLTIGDVEIDLMPDEEDGNPKPWEYIDMMNSMGTAGWELVGISFNCLIFKRPNAKVR